MSMDLLPTSTGNVRLYPSNSLSSIYFKLIRSHQFPPQAHSLMHSPGTAMSQTFGKNFQRQNPFLLSRLFLNSLPNGLSVRLRGRTEPTMGYSPSFFWVSGFPMPDSRMPGWTVGSGVPYAANSGNCPETLTPPAVLYIMPPIRASHGGAPFHLSIAHKHI